MKISKSRLEGQFVSFIFAIVSVTHIFGQTYSATLLSPTSDIDSRATAISATGAVVGSFRNAPSSWHAFLFDGKFTDLGTLGGAESDAAAINVTGDVVGSSDVAANTERHAFLYRAGEMYDLNTASGDSGITLSSAVQISDSGQIVVLAKVDNSLNAFMLSPLSNPACTNADLGSGPVLHLWPTAGGCFALSPWKSSAPYAGLGPEKEDGAARLLAFNSRGDGVGFFAPNNTEKAAIFLAKGSNEPTDLNSKIRVDSGWALNEARAINDQGQIAGSGIYQGHLQAFLLTPLQFSANASPQTGGTATPSVPAAQAGALPNQAGAAQPSSIGSLDTTGPAGGVLAGQYPNPTLAGISAGPVVFGNGTGTIGQDSSFSFNPTTKQLNVTSASNVANTAALNLTKGAGSSSTLDLSEITNSGKILRILQPNDQSKKTPTVYIDNGAGMYMRSWLTVSGTTNGLAGDSYSIVPPSNDPLMIGIWADVGTGLQVRTANLSEAYNYSNLDRHGNYTMSIEEDGSLRWGLSTRAAMDTGLSRDSAGVVQVNTGTKGDFADLKVRNLIANGSVQFMNMSSGAGTASLGSNSPASGLSQPATWLAVTLADGSTGYVPVWK